MNPTTPTQYRPARSWPRHAAQFDTPRLTRRSVLIADDQIDSVEALSVLLEWSGHEVHVALNGKDAVLAARQYRPELIFLDIAMPDLNGYEVCRRLRAMQEFADARIYAITAFTGEPHQSRRDAAGFTGQLTKPIDVDELERLLQ